MREHSSGDSGEESNPSRSAGNANERDRAQDGCRGDQTLEHAFGELVVFVGEMCLVKGAC